MNYPKCQNQNHNGKKVITVCMNQLCNKQRLCCLLCMNEFHSGHPSKIVEIGDIYQFIQQESNKPDIAQTCNHGQNQIIQGLEQLNILIDSFQKIIRGEIEQRKQQNLQNMESFQQYLRRYSNIQIGSECSHQFLEGILQYVSVGNGQLTLMTLKEGYINELEEQQIKKIKDAQLSLQKIISQMNLNQIECKNLYFLENRKNVDIAIIDNCTLKKIRQGSYAMAYANEGFDPSKESYQFAFNIQVQNKYVWVGVGNDEGNNVPSHLISEAKWATVGHGQYMICQNSYIVHHTDVELNNKPIGMYYKVGDKIYVNYDHVSKMLEFRIEFNHIKIQKQTVVKILITDMSKRLYPGALLYHPDDQVQLVSN